MSYNYEYRTPSTYSTPLYSNSYRSVTPKWWKPQDEKQRKTFENLKSDIKTVLTICSRGISTRKAYDDFAEQIDGEIAYKDLGFKNFGEFLFHCDDVLEVRTDGCNGHYIFLRGGRADDDTEHLRRLVEGQSKSTKYKGFKARQGNTRLVPSDTLLNVMRRSEPVNGMSNGMARSSYGANSYGSSSPVYSGRGRGYGRATRGGRGGGSRSGSSSAFTPGMNGIPNLVPYNAANPQPTSSAAQTNANNSYSESGKTATASRTFQPLEPLPPTMGYMRVRDSLGGNRSSGKQVTPGLLRAVLSHIEDDDDSGDDSMDEWTWSSAVDHVYESKKSTMTNNKFDDPKYWSDGEDMVDNTMSGRTKALNKADESITGMETSISLPVNKGPTSSLRVPVVPTIPSEVAQSYQSSSSSISTRPSEYVKAVFPPRVAVGSASSTSASQNNSVSKSTHSAFAVPSTPAKPISPFRSSETKILLGDDSKNVSLEPSNVGLATLISRPPPSAAIVGYKPPPVRNVKYVEAWQQMKMPTVEHFNAKLLGVDGFGFTFIQIDDPAINKGFEELKHSLQNFYSSPEILNEYRVHPTDIRSGLMVVAYVEQEGQGTFVRCNIYEADVKNNFCILVELEEHDFHDVTLNNIYHIDKRFRTLRPRALMCTLAGLEPYMMTQEITDAFEMTPLDPPEVKVTLKHPGKMFKVPCVTMTIGGGDDVVGLIKLNGHQFFKEFNSQFDRTSRKDLQNVQIEMLERLNYFPAP